MKPCCTITTFSEAIIYCIERDNLEPVLVGRIDFWKALKYWRRGFMGHEAYETIVRRLKNRQQNCSKKWAGQSVRKITGVEDG